MPSHTSHSTAWRCISHRPARPSLHTSNNSLDRSQPPCTQRTFHVSSTRRTRQRADMYAWLNGPGAVFRKPLAGSTNYLSAYDKQGRLARTLNNAQDEGNRRSMGSRRGSSDELPKERPSDLRPFPLNRYFRSQSVLSEEMREDLYNQVVVRKMDISSVAAAYGIDMRRVGAVIRLKTIEKQWLADGRKLAKPYQDAVLGMLPQTPYRDDNGRIVHHEGINDLPVHPATRQQLFVPTSESRQYTREDAAKAFAPALLPADKRIAHPELIEIAKWSLEGLSREERFSRMRLKDAETRAENETKQREEKARMNRTQKTVAGRRWDFKFQDVSVESVGRDGRGKDGVGHRYGMPHEDRKKQNVKIATSVE